MSAGTPSSIEVAPESTGPKVETRKVTRPDGAEVHRTTVAVPDQIVVSGDVLLAILAELQAIRVGLTILTDQNLDPSQTDFSRR